jgi:hypothetical protein
LARLILFLKLHEFFDGIHQAKEVTLSKIKDPLSDGTVPNRFSDLFQNKYVNGNYKYTIGLFDDTLKELVDATKKALLAPLIGVPSSPVAEAAPVVSPPRKPRTRSLRRDSPLVALCLHSERTWYSMYSIYSKDVKIKVKY